MLHFWHKTVNQTKKKIQNCVLHEYILVLKVAQEAQVSLLGWYLYEGQIARLLGPVVERLRSTGVNQLRSVWVISVDELLINRAESVWKCDKLIAIIIIWVQEHNRYSIGTGAVWEPGVLVHLLLGKCAFLVTSTSAWLVTDMVLVLGYACTGSGMVML